MKSKFFFMAFVMPFLTILAFSLKAQDLKILDVLKDSLSNKAEIPNFAPRGIYAIPKSPFDNTPTQRTWKNDCIDGVTVRKYWKDLNPKQNIYEWKELDSLFEVANVYGKKVHLIIAPGFRSPQWVFDDKRVKRRKFKYPRNYPDEGIEKGDMLPLPLPWDPIYLDYWFTFVDTLANRYGPNPALTLVAVTGPNGHNGEVNLPREASDIKTWHKLFGNGTDAEEKFKDKTLEAYRKTINHFHRAFARKYGKYYSLQIFRRSFPVEDTAVQKAFQNSLIAHAASRKNPEKHFVLMNASLDGWPFAGGISDRYDDPYQPPDQWVRIANMATDGFVTGYQTRQPIDDKQSERGTPKAINRFRQIIKNGIRFGASFLEIYERDSDDKSLRDLIAAGSLLLKGRKCTCE